ncbi:MAG: HTH-type transcriptional activator CmpR [Syntrophorhabdaceae bacterium PtaU1.Bin034]|nr:MAG: HTH-type transcriptional activator CmpR [Syntrophorhabdaceae bacterium PtaU1.Bin034]
MNLNQLRAFHSVVKTGTFSRAAENLFVTEPAVFIQVRSLERCLGFKLLDKSGKDLTLTETGKLLYEYAEKIFVLVDEADKAVKEIQEVKSGHLRVAAANTLAQYLMPMVISSFRDNYPRIHLHVDEGSSTEVVKGILAHRYEVAVVARVPYPDKINVLPLSRDEVLLITSPQSSLSLVSKCSLRDLDGQPMICKDIRSATGQAIWTELEKRNVKPSSIIEAGNTEFIKALVGDNKGVSFLAKLCVIDEIDRGELVAVPIEEGPFYLQIDAIHLKGKDLSPAASKFLHFLQQGDNPLNLEHLIGEMQSKARSARSKPH